MPDLFFAIANPFTTRVLLLFPDFVAGKYQVVDVDPPAALFHEFGGGVDAKPAAAVDDVLQVFIRDASLCAHPAHFTRALFRIL